MIRKTRKSALEHFQKNPGGEFIYTGRYYRYVEDKKPRKRMLLELWGLGLTMMACIIICGCIPAPGMIDTFCVLAPFALEIILGGMSLWALGQMTFGDYPLKEYVYQDSAAKLPGRFLATAVLGVVTLLMELLFLILHKTLAGQSLLVLVLQGGAFLLAVLGRRLAGESHWEG